MKIIGWWRKAKLETRKQKREDRKSKARWRPEGRRYTGEEKRDFIPQNDAGWRRGLLYKPTHFRQCRNLQSQERMRKKKPACFARSRNSIRDAKCANDGVGWRLRIGRSWELE